MLGTFSTMAGWNFQSLFMRSGSPSWLLLQQKIIARIADATNIWQASAFGLRHDGSCCKNRTTVSGPTAGLLDEAARDADGIALTSTVASRSDIHLHERIEVLLRVTEVSYLLVTRMHLM
jgi:hypothetical protein